MSVRDGHAATSARSGRPRRLASQKPGIETTSAAAMTIARVGSHPPFGIASTSRKPSTLAVSVMPEMTSPAPKMKPQNNANRIGMVQPHSAWRVIATTSIATAMNVTVAAIERGERRAIPQMPWPEVQPLPSRVPNPTSRPAIDDHDPSRHRRSAQRRTGRGNRERRGDQAQR